MTPATQVKLLRVSRNAASVVWAGAPSRRSTSRDCCDQYRSGDGGPAGQAARGSLLPLNVFSAAAADAARAQGDLPLLVQRSLPSSTRATEIDRRRGSGGDADDRTLRVAGNVASCATSSSARRSWPLALHRDEAPAARPDRRAAVPKQPQLRAGAGTTVESGAAVDRHDPRAHARQQDARREILGISLRHCTIS